jgi:hypothetical protein
MTDDKKKMERARCETRLFCFYVVENEEYLRTVGGLPTFSKKRGYSGFPRDVQYFLKKSWFKIWLYQISVLSLYQS